MHNAEFRNYSLHRILFEWSNESQRVDVLFAVHLVDLIVKMKTILTRS
jgi:hypothetical protein